MTYNPRIRNKRSSIIQVTGSTLSVTGSIASSGNLTVSGTTSGSVGLFTSLTGTLNGLATSVLVATSDVTLTNNNHVVLADATSIQINVTLPLASNSKFRQYIIKKTDNSSNKVVISGSSSETIDGLNGRSIGTQYETLTIINDGANKWFIL